MNIVATPLHSFPGSWIMQALWWTEVSVIIVYSFLQVDKIAILF